MAKKSKYKMRISGNVVEIWEYENPIFLEGNNSGGRRKADQPKSEKSEEYREQNTRRSKDKFRSLVSSNFADGDKFLTLTFRDTDLFDIRSVVDTNKQFKKFIQRLRYHCKKIKKPDDFKYIAVIEFQDENKRGAVHYHVMLNIPYIHYEDLAEIWGLGFVGINQIKGVDNIGAYLSKYMAKDQGDPRLEGKKNYLPSKNLDQPEIHYGSDVKKLMDHYKKTQKKEVFQDCYDSEHFGNITYKEYNLKREVTQTKIGKGLKDQLIAEDQIKAMKDQIYKNTTSLVDQGLKYLEDKENGQITIDERILGEIENREKRAMGKTRSRNDILQEFAKIQGVHTGSRKGRKKPFARDEKPDHGINYQLNYDWQLT